MQIGPLSTPAAPSVTGTRWTGQSRRLEGLGRHHLEWPGHCRQRSMSTGQVGAGVLRVCLASRPELSRYEKANSQTNPDSHGKEGEEVMEFVLFGSRSSPGPCPGWSSCALGSRRPVPRDLGRPALLGSSGIVPNPRVNGDVAMETARPPQS